ncbi:hypothetical protein ABLE91_26870 [Aquabacter sp. CN5-332]
MGRADLGNALDDLASGRIKVGEPGMAVYALSSHGEQLQEVHWSLPPALA